jgi:hypothetical protein
MHAAAVNVCPHHLDYPVEVGKMKIGYSGSYRFTTPTRI